MAAAVGGMAAASSHCALVSAAGSLRGKGYGARIDAHTHVVRLGEGPSGGAYRADVGARTALRIIHCHPPRPNQSVDAFRQVLAREGWPPVAHLDCGCESGARLLRRPPPACLRRTRCFEPFHPTTGLQAVLHLLHEPPPAPPVRGWPRCDVLHLYGFSERTDVQQATYWSEAGWHAHNHSTRDRMRVRLAAADSSPEPFPITRAEVGRFCRRPISERTDDAWRAV